MTNETQIPEFVNPFEAEPPEVVVEATDIDKVETAPEVVEESDDVVQAKAAGWRPKEEYEGDPNSWVDAGEFVRRGQLFDKISTQSRELKELRKVVEGLTEHNRKLAETKKQEEINAIKKAKQMAIEDGDHAAIVELDEMLFDRKQELKEAQQQTNAEAASQVHPAYWEFAQANPWYTKDKAMTAFADERGRELFESGYSMPEIYKKLSNEVRTEFAHKFKPKSAPVTVETPRSVNKSTAPKFQPSPQEKAMAAMFARQGIMTADEYYEQLKAQR